MNSRKTIRYTMEDVAPAVAMLQKGGLVALPTETVYGLAVNAENSAAVWVLYEVKQREREKALSVLVTGMEMVENYCQNIPPQAYALAEHYWPGPLTMILEDKGVVSALVNDGSGTLGVRCPDHPLTQAILRQAGVALAAPSANPSDQPSPKTAQEVLEAAEQRIYAIRQGRSAQGLAHISSVILNVYERLNELAASDSAVPGLSTGLPDVDMAISGLNKSDLILLAARPGMGKTSFALNMLLHAGKFSGKTVVFFSLEMSREQLAMRLISGESFVDNKKLVTGKLGEEDWTKIAAASAALNQTQILIDDNPSLSVADMNAKCRRVDNLGLVVIDYLQLMTSAGGPTRSGDNRQQIVSDISRALKIMAKELNVPVVCLSQLSRGPESRSDKRPMLSDLRESGAIEQDADIVMFLYRDDYYNDSDENHNLAECIIAKNRHGETRTVELQWLPEYTTFSSIDRRHIEY